MRLIQCDRCGEQGKLGDYWDKPPTPARWGNLFETYENGDADVGTQLCPACVERALEKPERDPVLAATDFPDVPMEPGGPGTVDALMHGEDIALHSEKPERVSGSPLGNPLPPIGGPT